MESKYTIKFTAKAEWDLDEIYNYISIELSAEDAAINLMDKIQFGIMSLKDFPLSCSYVLDKPLRSKGYRKLIIGNYIVFYLVSELERQVVIMRILYGASNYNGVL